MTTITPEAKGTCTVRDGRFVEPCEALASLIDNIAPGFSRAKGIAKWSLTDVATHKPSRSYVGAITDQYPKGGFLFNFCPVCGASISAPFMSED